VPAIAVLLDSRAGLLALRRSLPRGGPRVVTCRTFATLQHLLCNRLVEAVVVTPHATLLGDLAELRGKLPAIPVVAYAPFRPDDGDLLLACRRSAVAAIAVEGVDDPIVGDMVMRHSLVAARRRALAQAPRLLRLTEPLQQAAWHLLLAEVERPMRTAALAKRLRVSREHLSRQFGAGGAPNIKRVIDLTRIVTAAQLLAGPGYSILSIVRILGFASASHLNNTARRIADVPAAGIGTLGPAGVLTAFLKGNTRSRP
jgi:AraC-like DNA-binding protein